MRSSSQKVCDRTHHLKERQVALADIVKVDFRVGPRQVLVQAVGPVVYDLRKNIDRPQVLQQCRKNEIAFLCRCDSNLKKRLTNRYVYFISSLVQAFVEFATEKLDAHDGENKPEHQAHQQHVEDGRDCVHQCVHHDL